MAGRHNSNNPIQEWIDGGAGVDEVVIDYSDNNQDLEFVLRNGYLEVTNLQTGSTQPALYTNNIESFNLTTGRHRDRIHLNNSYSDNIIDNTINTGGGNDEIISTGSGFNVVDGGRGYDLLNLDFSNNQSGITSSLNDSNSGEYFSDYGSIEFENIEAVNVTGSMDDDIIRGLRGQDTIYGEFGADTLIGGDSNDSLNGGDGNDLLRGGNHDDTLFGGAEKDILFGDGGMDIFALEANATQFDVIRDFVDGIDSFGLTDGMAFENLKISNRNVGNGIIIRNANNNDVIAVVVGVEAMDITSEDFVAV